MTFSKEVPLTYIAHLHKLVKGTFSSRRMWAWPMGPKCKVDFGPYSCSWSNGLGQFPTCTTVHGSPVLKDEKLVLYFGLYSPVSSTELGL